MASDLFPWESWDSKNPFGDGARGARPPSDGPYQGQSILGAGSPREVLALLLRDDPFELQARCVERIREHAFLVSLDRAYLRTIARVAYAAPRYRGVPDLDVWLRARIDHALHELNREEYEADQAGNLPRRPIDPMYEYLGEALGLEIGLARRACIAINRLGIESRRVFFAVIVDRATLDRYVADGHGPRSLAQARLQAAIDAVRDATGWDGRAREGRAYEEF